MATLATARTPDLFAAKPVAAPIDPTTAVVLPKIPETQQSSSEPTILSIESPSAPVEHMHDKTTCEYMVEETMWHRVLRPLNIVLALVHGAMAGVVLFATTEAAKFPMYRSPIGPPRGPPEEGEAFWLVPGEAERVTTFDFRILIFAFFAVTSVAHLSYGLVFWSTYVSNIRKCRNPFRWLEYGVSAPIMAICVSFFLGVQDYFVAIGILGLTATTMTFGYIAEETARPSSENTYCRSSLSPFVPHVMGYLPQAIAWYLILRTFFINTASDPGPPEWVDALVWSMLVFFWSFGLVQLVCLCMPPSRFVAGEFAYATLSAICKLLLGLSIFAQVLISSGSLGEAGFYAGADSLGCESWCNNYTCISNYYTGCGGCSICSMPICSDWCVNNTCTNEFCQGCTLC